jgi:outer membrane protein, heavy metal efflux system
MHKHVLLGVLVASVFTGRAAAQVENTSLTPLTLDAAIAEALERHPTLVALRAQYDAARAAPARERFLVPPTLEAQVWAWPITTLNPARTDMYMFMAEQELPGRGKRAARVLVAERDADIARQQVPVEAAALVGEIRVAFVELGVARQLRALYDDQRRLLRDMTEAATIRYASGSGGQHHSIAALVELTRLERDVIAADERVHSAEARLNAAVGWPLTRQIGALAPVAASVSVADAEALALARHPEFAMVDARVAREEAELARLRGERRPDFVVGGGYMLMPGDAGALTVRGGVTWPNAPWSRGRVSAMIDAQSRRVDAAKAQRETVALRVRRTVRDATIRLEAAERQVRLMQSSVLPQVEHAFELARLAYSGGEGDFAGMLESRRLVFTTQLELTEAHANASRAYAALETAVGLQ